jgi:predicted double-glycine peptidase
MLRIICCFLAITIGGTAQGQVVSLAERRHSDVVLQKFDVSCAAAAEATLLHLKFGDNVSERDVSLGLIARKEYIDNPAIVRIRQGFSLLDLKRYAEQRGYRGRGLGDMSLAELVELAPVIVPVRFYGYNHFVVFRGVTTNGRVVLADPAYGNRSMTTDRFMRAWIEDQRLGRMAFTLDRQ